MEEAASHGQSSRGVLPDGLAIAQWEGGTEFTQWVHQGLEEPGDLLIQKVHKKERTKARAKK